MQRNIRGPAFIPAPTEHLQGLAFVNADFLSYVPALQSRHRSNAGYGMPHWQKPTKTVLCSATKDTRHINHTTYTGPNKGSLYILSSGTEMYLQATSSSVC